MPPPPTPYDADFYVWTQEQAAALRQVAALRINLPNVDLEHLAEEVEDMGNDILARIEGLAVQVLIHLLKLDFCPDQQPRDHWRGEIANWRTTIRRRSRRSPSALGWLDRDDLMTDALIALRARYAGQAWLTKLPEQCPYTIAQILDFDFWPAGRQTADTR